MPDSIEREIRLKVCGMRDPANLREVLNLHPDLVGLIFYPGSKRFIGSCSAEINAIDWPASVGRVGVFVNETTDRILEMVDEYRLGWVQLHGDEPARQCDILKSRGLKIIKAFGIDHGFDPGRLVPYASVADRFLFDTVTVEHGGSGRTFDWDQLSVMECDTPFILSGGLDIGMERNIVKLAAERPVWGIDINSRFELKPGLKDVSRVKAFDEAMRNLERKTKIMGE